MALGGSCLVFDKGADTGAWEKLVADISWDTVDWRSHPKDVVVLGHLAAWRKTQDL